MQQLFEVLVHVTDTAHFLHYQHISPNLQRSDLPRQVEYIKTVRNDNSALEIDTSPYFNIQCPLSVRNGTQ